jgi:iron(III) transport system substrate-binding protein
MGIPIRLRSMGTRLMAGLLIGTLALTGCSSGDKKAELVEGSWEDVVAAAEKEGKVVFYAGISQLPIDRLITAFNKKYPGIKVQAERITSDGIARVEAQIKSGTEGADVFMLADTEWFKQFADELLPVNGPGTEGLRDGAWIVPNSAAAVSGVPYSMFVWNTNKFPNGFDDWQDFLDPSVKGQLAMRDSASTSAAGFLDFLVENFGEDYVKALGEQKPKLYASVVPMTNAVAAGEVGVTMASSPAEVMALKSSGAPIEFKYPTPAYGIDYGAAALKNSRRPNAAVVFMDFILSPEGQEALNGDGLGVPARADVAGGLDPSGFTMLEASKYTPEVTAKWQELIDTYFK